MTDAQQRALRGALGMYATGVAVVTAAGPEQRPVAMTVNSFATVSLDPPLVLWSIQRDVGPFAEFMDADHYAVHVLHAGQQGAADHFAQSLDDKFAGRQYQVGPEGLPLLDDFCARFQCGVERRIPAGDHVILLGRVLDFEQRPTMAPLIFHAGRYAALLR